MTTLSSSDIHFVSAQEEDFEDFRALRKSVIREHVERQGMGWDEVAEDRYHAKLFALPGLRKVFWRSQAIGYVGVRDNPDDDGLILDRFCLARGFQGRGIGTAAMEKIFGEPDCQGKTISIDVLSMNPAIRLYERLGFARVGQDGMSVFLRRGKNCRGLAPS